MGIGDWGVGGWGGGGGAQPPHPPPPPPPHTPTPNPPPPNPQSPYILFSIISIFLKRIIKESYFHEFKILRWKTNTRLFL